MKTDAQKHAGGVNPPARDGALFYLGRCEWEMSVRLQEELLEVLAIGLLARDALRIQYARPEWARDLVARHLRVYRST